MKIGKIGIQLLLFITDDRFAITHVPHSISMVSDGCRDVDHILLIDEMLTFLLPTNSRRQFQIIPQGYPRVCHKVIVAFFIFKTIRLYKIESTGIRGTRFFLDSLKLKTIVIYRGIVRRIRGRMSVLSFGFEKRIR